jgi:hypothetical protein
LVKIAPGKPEKLTKANPEIRKNWRYQGMGREMKNRSLPDTHHAEYH